MPGAPAGTPGQAPVMTLNQVAGHALTQQQGNMALVGLGEGIAEAVTAADIAPAAAPGWPTWMKVLAGISLASVLIAVGVVILKRR